MQVVESTTNCVVITSTAKQQPKLMDRVRSDLRVRHYSLATERAYCHWIKRFIHWSGLRHPADIGAAEVQAFLSHLATDGESAAPGRERHGGLTGRTPSTRPT